jgi:hypothetical protein
MIVGFPVWIGPRISPGQVVRPMISEIFVNNKHRAANKE